MKEGSAMASRNENDWLSRALTMTSVDRSFPSIVYAVRIFIAVVLVIATALYFSIDDWWAVFLLPVAGVVFFIGHKGYHLNRKLDLDSETDAAATS
jgi:fatty acid desaturase